MRRVQWLIVVGLVLAGCEDYFIRAVTKVGDDGSFHRRLSIKGEDDTPRSNMVKGQDESAEAPGWTKFVKPGAPYELSGPTEEEGWVVEAAFQRGARPNGIRRRLSEEGEAFAEGRIRVEVSDLLIGRLYRFRENVATGADPVLFRRDLRKWLEVSLRVFMEALRYKLPQADLDGVERNARERLIPRVEASILLVRQNLESLTFDYRARGATDSFEEWEGLVHHGSVGLIIGELAKYGLARAKGREKPTSGEDLFDEGAWEFRPRFVREFFAPMRGVTETERAELIASFLDGSIELDMEGAFENLYPSEEEREALQVEADRFAVASVGSYAWHGIVDEHDFEFELTMPGMLLSTNGELGGAPAIRWRIDDTMLFLRDPEMYAVSFIPGEGAPASGWRLAPLVRLRGELDGVSEKDRARLRAYLATAREKGWEAVVQDVDKNAQHLSEAVVALRQAVEPAAG